MAIIGEPEKVWELPAPADIPAPLDLPFEEDSPIPVPEKVEV